MVALAVLAGKGGRALLPAERGRPPDPELQLHSAVPRGRRMGGAWRGRGLPLSGDSAAGGGGRGQGASDAPSGW